METLYIVMPAYNEEENIKEVVTAWCAVLEKVNSNSRLVIADSGSTDSTHLILLDLQKTYPCLEIISNTGKQHGPKLLALYNYAINNGADFIFQTDSDGQTEPNEFATFWQLRYEYDVILGHRQTRGDGWIRSFVEHVVCLLLKFYFGVKVPDANAPFRLMKSNIVEKYIDRFETDYNLPNIMFTTFFLYYKERTIFIPITFKPRCGGKNSINIINIIRIGWKSLSDFAKFKKNM